MMENKQKRIAMICGDITAALNRRPEFCETLPTLGQRALFLCPPCDPSDQKTIEDMGFEVQFINSDKQAINPLADLGYLKNLKAILKTEQISDVFAFHLKPIMYSGIACRHLGIRFHGLFAGLGFLFSEQKGLKKKAIQKVAARVLAYSLAKAHTVIFQNNDDKQTLLQHRVVGDWNHNLVVVNGSGINLDSFPYSPVSDDRPLKFLLVARMLRDKGIPEYYKCARQIRGKWGDAAVFQLLGPFDDNPNALKPEQVEAWASEGAIDYLGITTDIRRYLIDSSVIVLPSFYMEGTPKVLLESLATGRPIITTDSRGCRETVRDGVNGFLVQPRNVPQLVEACEYFLQSPDQLLTKGQASRELARDKFDVTSVNHKMFVAMGLINSLPLELHDSPIQESVSEA